MPYKINTKKKSSLTKKDRIWLERNTFWITKLVTDAMDKEGIKMTPEGKYFDEETELEMSHGKVRFLIEKVFLDQKLPETLPNRILKDVIERIVLSVSSAGKVAWNELGIHDDPLLRDVKLKGKYR